MGTNTGSLWEQGVADTGVREVPDAIRRELMMLKMGRVTCCGVFTLTSSSGNTSTTVSPDKGFVSARSVVHTQAFSANAANADIIRIIPAKDAFTVTHTDPGGSTKTHRFVAFTGVRDTTFDP
jgi:hypothetical protein